jgi:uncharacterized repeat protein (TIGR03809 family)
VFLSQLFLGQFSSKRHCARHAKMTTTFDAARYQRALERWRMLAERRLEHMSLLYETGRWRRYFTEERFLSIIRETTESVERWRQIVPEPATAAPVLALSAEPAFVRTQPPPSPFEQQRSVA